MNKHVRKGQRSPRLQFHSASKQTLPSCQGFQKGVKCRWRRLTRPGRHGKGSEEAGSATSRLPEPWGDVQTCPAPRMAPGESECQFHGVQEPRMWIPFRHKQEVRGKGQGIHLPLHQAQTSGNGVFCSATEKRQKAYKLLSSIAFHCMDT
ncbi:hypothetical protein ANANG_G00135620 [Anguilla anguilla]|uniref:Uncharacterized protein n=1 Tax=Anguilla anguilla TaxID=7936 RepID=A0A9D3M9Z0_ANGAN|nr:hypothetical protein ANANG_G00135620 [Anguilla anguilla]